MAEEITKSPEVAAEEKPETVQEAPAAKAEGVEVKAEETQKAKATPKKAAPKKAPAAKTAVKKAPAKKAAAPKSTARKAAVKTAAKEAPVKKAAPKKTAAKKAPAKKAVPKAPEKATPGVYVIQTAKRVTESLPEPVSGYNEKILAAVTTGVDFVEEMSKAAMVTAAVYVDQGKQKVNERKAKIQGTVKTVADTATLVALEYNEKYVKKALESGKKTLETGTDLVEDMGMVALETFGTMAENGKKIAARLPISNRIKSLTSKVAALASK